MATVNWVKCSKKKTYFHVDKKLLTSENIFSQAEPMSLFIGGTIPVMAMLQSRYPDSKFIITGAGGPGGNAHGPDEKLHVPTAKKVTKCMAAALSAL